MAKENIDFPSIKSQKDLYLITQKCFVQRFKHENTHLMKKLCTVRNTDVCK